MLQDWDLMMRETVIPNEIGTILDFAAASAGWLLLTEDGSITRFDEESGACRRLASTNVPAEVSEWRNPVRRRMHVSRDGDFAAVLNDYARYGQLVDLRSGQVTMQLDGGDYHPDTVPFSFCFATVDGRTLAIHRTGWNRLDISDPATGELLTVRSPASYECDQPRPEHYLDYFHGAVFLSPDETQILDDGWVWQPSGAPARWSLTRWITENVWESEDGPTLKVLMYRDAWDRGGVWLDETRIAMSGIETEDDVTVDGATIFDLSSTEIRTFPGPAGTFFTGRASLYSSDATGLSQWNPSNGERLAHMPGFQPTYHDRAAEELVQLNDHVLLRWPIP